jgi:hypothetical protein
MKKVAGIVFLFLLISLSWPKPTLAAQCNLCPAGKNLSLCSSLGGPEVLLCAENKLPTGQCLGVEPPPANPCPTAAIPWAGCPDQRYINTALGCIPIGDANQFIKWFLGRAVMLAGGVAFLLMLSGGLIVLVSSGDPNRVKAGSELITSALAGLLFIIFSLFLLRLIGVELLKLPGL